MILTIITFLVILSVLVLAHEFGHFWTARKNGVGAEEFGLGFPPRALGFYHDTKGRKRYIFGNKSLDELEGDDKPRSTVYSVNILPLGGFVKIKGENGDMANDNDSFGSKKIWQRILILAAGVIMNIILAFILFTTCFLIGAPQSVDQGGKIQIAQVLEDSAASQAGVLSGDVIKELDGQEVENISAIQAYISGKANQEISFNILRGDENINLVITPKIVDEKAMVGISMDQVDTVRYSFFKAVWEGFKHTFLVLWLILLSFITLIKDLITGAGAGDAVGGPIKIAQMTGEVARFGFVNLINFTALLSLNLAVLNIFPFPALDGGRILFLIIEKIRGKALKVETEALVHNIGFMFLMALILFVTYKDIAGMF